MSTATVTSPSTIMVMERDEVVRLLHERSPFADAFLGHMLKGNIRIEEDLIDQLFNSTEKRLARALLLMARYGEPEVSAPCSACRNNSSPRPLVRPARG